MTKNMGTLDRGLRAIVGIVLITLAAMNIIGWWGYIGAVPLVTALVGICPAYLPFGIKTCKSGGAKHA
jgi:hypothetical protein